MATDQSEPPGLANSAGDGDTGKEDAPSAQNENARAVGYDPAAAPLQAEAEPSVLRIPTLDNRPIPLVKTEASDVPAGLDGALSPDDDATAPAKDATTPVEENAAPAAEQTAAEAAQPLPPHEPRAPAAQPLASSATLSSVVAARENAKRTVVENAGQHVDAPKQFAKDFIEASFGGAPLKSEAKVRAAGGPPAVPSPSSPGQNTASAPPSPVPQGEPMRVQTEKNIKAKRSVLAGKYLLKKEIAKGAMGRVFLAEQIALRREVAVKVMLPKYGGPDFDKRFMLEAQAVASLSHPNIVIVHDYGKVDNDLLYMAMEYLNGPTLGRFVAKHGAMPLGRACSIVMQIARALRAAHKAGMIHRDLKPGNVIVLTDEDEGDQVKVLDFGLAKMMETPDAPVNPDGPLTREGLMLGTPRYMAPEQITGKPVDERTDIYSLGAVFYRIVSGRHPFDGDNDVEILHAQLKKRPTPLHQLPGCEGFPPEIDAFIGRCMARKKADRIPSAKAFIHELKQVVMKAITDPAYRNVLTVGGKDGISTSLINMPSLSSDGGSSGAEQRFLPDAGSSSADTPEIYTEAIDLESTPPVAADAAFPIAPPSTEAPVLAEDRSTFVPIAAALFLFVVVIAAGYFILQGSASEGPTTGLPPQAEDLNIETPQVLPPGPEAVEAEPATKQADASKKARATTREENDAAGQKQADNSAFDDDGADADEPSAKTAARRTPAKRAKRRKSAPKKRRGVASKPSTRAGETAGAGGNTVVSDGTVLAAPADDKGRRRGANSNSINVGGVELASPDAVDRVNAKRRRGRSAEKVKGGDVTLADDYQ